MVGYIWNNWVSAITNFSHLWSNGNFFGLDFPWECKPGSILYSPRTIWFIKLSGPTTLLLIIQYFKTYQHFFNQSECLLTRMGGSFYSDQQYLMLTNQQIQSAFYIWQQHLQRRSQNCYSRYEYWECHQWHQKKFTTHFRVLFNKANGNMKNYSPE